MRLSFVPLFAILSHLTAGFSISGDFVEAIKRDSSSESHSTSPGYVKLSAKKSYAKSAPGLLPNSTTSASNSKSVAPLQRSTNSDDEDEFTMKNQAVFYSVDVSIGSKANIVTVLVDTGSSDFWVMSPRNPYCAAGTGGDSQSTLGSSSSSSSDDDSGKTLGSINCSKYGTFDPLGSSSWHNNGTLFHIEYADKTFAQGFWGYDQIDLGGVTIPDVNIAVSDNTDSEVGVLGISYAELESTNTRLSHHTYMNLPLTMKSQGLISKLTYSVYLDDPESETASILFGAIDQNKYTGDLALMPIVDVYDAGQPASIEVTISGMSVGSKKSNKKIEIASGAAAGLLDTGTTLLYVSKDVFNAITDVAGLSTSEGYPTADCSLGDDYYLSFNFQGFDVDISFKNLFLDTGDDSSSTCYLGIQYTDDDSFILGDKFLTSVYAVIDLEDNVVAMAKANTDSTSENIEVVSDSIPSASSVASYSATYGGAAGTSLSVTTTGSLNGGTKKVNVAARDVTSTADSSVICTSSVSFLASNVKSNSSAENSVSTAENSGIQTSAVGSLLTCIILVLFSAF
ncbi:unnamed protein product [Ambrosiozyma monospora]|uniref:candidapepsin n=1 Tax=Ambrosiozyma monospora TaxID=43982 RepID=A0A9W7DIB3_AMBMO|nr:unnamed protein product [Ambrosiozyma monospora]